MTDPAEQRFYKLVGAQIRRERAASGITLQRLSDETGVSLSMISLLERGEHGVSLWRAVLLCDYLGSGIDKCLEDAGV